MKKIKKKNYKIGTKKLPVSGCNWNSPEMRMKGAHSLSISLEELCICSSVVPGSTKFFRGSWLMTDGQTTILIS